MHTHTYTQVRQEAAKYAFAHGDDARVGAHAVLAAYFVGRDAPKAWTTLPKVHPLHQICACAHAMLMRNPVFPSQPWYWDAVEASGEGGDQADGVGAGGSGVTGEAGAGKSSTGKERVYNVRKLQGLVRRRRNPAMRRQERHNMHQRPAERAAAYLRAAEALRVSVPDAILRRRAALQVCK